MRTYTCISKHLYVCCVFLYMCICIHTYVYFAYKKCTYIFIYIYIYIYISTWLRPSPPPLIKGWFDHMEANYWSFAPHRPPKIIKMVTKRKPIQKQFMTNQSWG